MSDRIIDIKLVGDRKLIARFNAMPRRVIVALTRKSSALALKLEAKVKGKLSGPVLKVRTGALRRSIFNKVIATSEAVMAKVASSGDVKYAGIHEFGGKTPAHVITPVKAKALRFMMGGKQVFAMRVNHPGSNMPERSYLRSSLADMKDEIVEGLSDAVSEGLEP